MILSDFCELVRNNMTFFEKDYTERRDTAVNPDISHPIDRTPERWFEEMVMWFRLIEVMKRVNALELPEPNKELDLKEFEEKP